MKPSYVKYAEIRDGKGLNDYRVAKGSQINKATISCWKHGRYYPNVKNMCILASFLNVPLEKLIEE